MRTQHIAATAAAIQRLHLHTLADDAQFAQLSGRTFLSVHRQLRGIGELSGQRVMHKHTIVSRGFLMSRIWPHMSLRPDLRRDAKLSLLSVVRCLRDMRRLDLP